MMERTLEGWIIVDSERRNDDPFANDDCWHRGPYSVYSVRGTNIRIEERANDGIGHTWDRLEEAMRNANLTGIIELMGHAVKGLGYRRILTIETQAELDTKREEAERYNREHPYNDFD